MIITALYWEITVKIQLHTSSGKQPNGLTGPFKFKPKIYQENKLYIVSR